MGKAIKELKRSNQRREKRESFKQDGVISTEKVVWRDKAAEDLKAPFGFHIPKIWVTLTGKIVVAPHCFWSVQTVDGGKSGESK